jgi:hypothetical protein
MLALERVVLIGPEPRKVTYGALEKLVPDIVNVPAPSSR